MCWSKNVRRRCSNSADFGDGSANMGAPWDEVAIGPGGDRPCRSPERQRSAAGEDRGPLLGEGALRFLGIVGLADLRRHVLLVAVAVAQAHVLDDVQGV